MLNWLSHPSSPCQGFLWVTFELMKMSEADRVQFPTVSSFQELAPLSIWMSRQNADASAVQVLADFCTVLQWSSWEGRRLSSVGLNIACALAGTGFTWVYFYIKTWLLRRSEALETVFFLYLLTKCSWVLFISYLKELEGFPPPPRTRNFIIPNAGA